MSSFYIKTLSLFFLISTTFSVKGQNLKEQLIERIEGKKDFTEIVKEVDQFYNELPSDHQTKSFGGIHKLKHIKRLEWYLSGRLDENGYLTNVDSMLAIANKEHIKKFSSSSKAPVLWNSIGPQNSDRGIGRVDRIEFHPTNANIIYAGAPAGGLWRSNDGGNTWNNLTDNIGNPGISGIAINQSNPNIIYILTGDGDSIGFVEAFGYSSSSRGVYRSSDGGVNWTQWNITGLNEEYDGYALILHPTIDGELYVATSKGLYHRFQDLFNNWVWEEEIDGHFWDVEFKPNDPNTVYAAGEGTIWRTVNEGGTWGTTTYTANEAPCSNVERIQLAVTKNNSNTVYALMGPVTSSGIFCGLYKSTDSGNLFDRIRNTPNILGRGSNGLNNVDQSEYDLAIAANPNNVDDIYTGGIQIWRSTNGGSTMNFLNSTYHVDIHDLKYNPVNGNIFAATDGGVYRSTDGGATWIDLSDGLRVSQIYHMSGSYSDPHDLYIGSQDNGIFSREGDTDQYELRSGGDGFASAEMRVAPFKRFFASINRQVIRFSNSGTGWDSNNVSPNGTTGGGAENWFKNIATHNTDNKIALIGSQDIWRSANAASISVDWTNVGASGSWSITNCKSDDDRFYSAGGDSYLSGAGSIYRSDDAGLTWNEIKNTGFPSSFTKITEVAVSPTSSDYVCASFGGFTSGTKVVRSINAGETWVNISYNLPNAPINCVEINDGLDVYVGTDIGVYRLPFGQTTWSYVSPTIPQVPITDIILDDENALIYASTFGRGVYRSSLADLDCISDHNLFLALNAIKNYEADNVITSTSFINSYATIQMKAGEAVILKPPFKTDSGVNLLRAYIGGCNDNFYSSDQ